MRGRSCCNPLAILVCLVAACSANAAADTVYENGPINGETDGWTINFGFVITDTFTVSAGNSTITGMSFGAWLTPGDVLTSAEVSITQFELGGAVYFDGIVNFTQSNCFLNNYSYDICTESGTFSGPTLANGTYWVALQNAVTTNGDPVYWDENSGVGCDSPGCPSEAGNGGIADATLPSEAFTILGTVQTSTTGTVPEPASLILFASGVVGVASLLRRKFQ